MKLKKLFFGLVMSSVLLTGCGNDTLDDSSAGKKTDGTFIYYDNGYIEAANTNLSGEIVIPEQYEGVAIKKIRDNGFAGCTKITKVTIPVLAGRSVSLLVESAAMNEKLKLMGHFAAKEFIEKVDEKASKGEE